VLKRVKSKEIPSFKAVMSTYNNLLQKCMWPTWQISIQKIADVNSGAVVILLTLKTHFCPWQRIQILFSLLICLCALLNCTYKIIYT
jgi:hypothetical protein